MIGWLRDIVRRSPLVGPIADGLSFIKSPQTMRRLLADARQTHANAAFARTLPPPRADAPLALVLSMTNFSYGVKLECMLSLALRLRGWRVQVLTSGLYTNARRIFAAYGIEEMVAFETLVENSEAESAIRAEVARRAAERMDFQSVMAWTYRDAWIGPQMLSSVSRQKFVGAPDPRDASVRAALLQQLPVTLSFAHAAERRLAAKRPDLILVNEPNFHVLGPFVDVAIARSIPAIHFIQPSRDDALVLKRLTKGTRRIHPNSISGETLERLLAEPWSDAQEAALDFEFRQRYGGTWRVQARNQPGVVEMTGEEIHRTLGLDRGKPTAVLFSHVLWDANLFYGEDLFENYGHWFVESVKAAAANPRVNWLIKLHPANLWKRKMSGVTDEYGEIALIREHVGELPGHVRMLPPDTPISTLSLFRMIDAGITVRGSIGYELPCFGVPVVTAGTGRYSGFRFTLDHASAKDYLATLARLETLPRLSAEAVRRAKVHAYALFVRRPWLYTSFRSEFAPDPTDPLFQNLYPTVRSHLDIRRNGDLDAFADWAVGSHNVDYLAGALPDARSVALRQHQE